MPHRGARAFSLKQWGGRLPVFQGSAIKLICGIALVFSLLMIGEGVVLGIMIALAVCLGAALLQY